MLKKLLALLVLLAMLEFVGCKKFQAAEHGETINIAVSIFPICDIARNICGEKARVIYSIPSGSDPHTFEPKPSIARELQNMDLFIGIEKEFDGWMEKYLPEKCVKKYLIDTTTKVRPRNPHIWLSVREAEKISHAIFTALSGIDPQNNDYYAKNMNDYSGKLKILDSTITAMYVNKINRSFIQWHDAWNYFASDYDLKIIGTIEREGSERSSVWSIKEVIEKAKSKHVTAIVVALVSEDRKAEVMASEINGALVHLDSMGDPESPQRSNYFNLMYYNAETLAQALR